LAHRELEHAEGVADSEYVGRGQLAQVLGRYRAGYLGRRFVQVDLEDRPGVVPVFLGHGR
jgi:hypothetical protein